MAPTVHELNDLFWRAVWTAIPAFTGALMLGGTGAIGNEDFTFGAAHAGLVAAASAVINVVTVYARQKLPGTGINVQGPVEPKRGENK